MTNPRIRKIADRIQVIVAEMLERRIKDPRLGFVTVTDVRVTGDSPAGDGVLHRARRGGRPGEHGGRAGVGQGPAPLRGRQAARHAARADPDLRGRRRSRRTPATSTRCWPGPRPSTRRPRPGASSRTPARPTPTRSPARTTRTRPRSRGDPARRLVPRSSDSRLRPRRRRQAGRDDLPRRRRPGTPAGRHPQGRPRRHPRPDGHRGPGARGQPRHPAARATSPSTDKRYDATVRLGVDHHHRRRRGRGRRAPGPTDALTARRRTARAARRSSARSTRCPARSRRSRSTGSAPTPASAPARTSTCPRAGSPSTRST